jgi:cytochrome c oxidase cbb3-type subunit 3/ubiquinol-cytochrome c reductase cytochrome c subunit
MKRHAHGILIFAAALALGAAGCNAPGKPRPGLEDKRPEDVLNVATLYTQNCAACHGDQGHHGAAISLANSVYLDAAKADNIVRVTSDGVPGTMMPPFAKSKGGMLTDQQIAVLVHGMVAAWSKPDALAGQTPPAYASSAPGVAANGQKAFVAYCARCHGADGAGAAVGKMHTGSLVDPAYLALISDQGLRSLLIAGQPDEGMPDWRGPANGSQQHALSDQEITDIVAWLAAHRTATPGQPYRQHP